MSAYKDGGPAFPRAAHYDEEGPTHLDHMQQEGMSLRDYFAAKALAGICADPDTTVFECFDVPDAFEQAALVAYDLADAMLAQRNKEED